MMAGILAKAEVGSKGGGACARLGLGGDRTTISHVKLFSYFIQFKS